MARARSFGNIRKLPSGRYQARYWHLGKQIPAVTTFANKTDARRWLATIEADMFRGVWIDPNAGKIPFGEYATRWVAERPVRPRTREGLAQRNSGSTASALNRSGRFLLLPVVGVAPLQRADSRWPASHHPHRSGRTPRSHFRTRAAPVVHMCRSAQGRSMFGNSDGDPRVERRAWSAIGRPSS